VYLIFYSAFISSVRGCTWRGRYVRVDNAQR
jgi:hypothetical protein